MNVSIDLFYELIYLHNYTWSYIYVVYCLLISQVRCGIFIYVVTIDHLGIRMFQKISFIMGYTTIGLIQFDKEQNKFIFFVFV